MSQDYPEFTSALTPDGQQWVLVANFSEQARADAQNFAVDKTLSVLRKRIDELGVNEPIVQRQGADRISVDLPGVKDTARAKQIIGGTATLEFHLQDVQHDAGQAKETGLYRQALLCILILSRARRKQCRGIITR